MAAREGIAQTFGLGREIEGLEGTRLAIMFIRPFHGRRFIDERGAQRAQGRNLFERLAQFFGNCCLYHGCAYDFEVCLAVRGEDVLPSMAAAAMMPLSDFVLSPCEIQITCHLRPR